MTRSDRFLLAVIAACASAWAWLHHWIGVHAQ